MSDDPIVSDPEEFTTAEELEVLETHPNAIYTNAQLPFRFKLPFGLSKV
jgi:hypothetical protein